jgi:hypothetical protein
MVPVAAMVAREVGAGDGRRRDGLGGMVLTGMVSAGWSPQDGQRVDGRRNHGHRRMLAVDGEYRAHARGLELDWNPTK